MRLGLGVIALTADIAYRAASNRRDGQPAGISIRGIRGQLGAGSELGVCWPLGHGHGPMAMAMAYGDGNGFGKLIIRCYHISISIIKYSSRSVNSDSK